MAAKHAGIKEFTGEETANLFLGQAGFHILAGGGAPHAIGATETIANLNGDISHTGKNAGTYWCAIKAIDGGSTVSARSYNDSDDFTKTGAYNGAQIAMADGDIIYGAFDAITIDTGQYIIAYIGK